MKVEALVIVLHIEQMQNLRMTLYPPFEQIIGSKAYTECNWSLDPVLNSPPKNMGVTFIV